MKLHRKLKHTFIPHKDNDYKPHFFREASMSIILIASLGLFAVSGSSALVIKNTEVGARIVVGVLIDLTNNQRISNHLQPLVHNKILDAAATLKAQDMVNKGYFAHNSPEGKAPWYWFGQAGYFFLYAGENLAVNFSESNEVENAWMNSPLHRANILDTKFKEIGLATLRGVYEGNETTFVVQLFGTPSFSVVKKIDTSTSTATTTKSVLLSQAKKTIKRSPSSIGDSPVVKGDTFLLNNDREVVAVNDAQAYSVAREPSNGTYGDDVASVAPLAGVMPVYSKWYERVIYNNPILVSIIYALLAVLVGIALFLMIFIEIKKQHPKNILYGVLMLTILVLLIRLNEIYFIKGIPFI